MTTQPASPAPASPGVASVADSERRALDLGIIPVVEISDLGQAEPLYEALCAGGLPAAEITLRTAVGLEAIELLVASHPDGFIGAGTVRSVADAARALDAGARFVVSPGTDAQLIGYCREKDVLVMPGVCTPTEILAALGAGAELLKFFPAEASGGTAFLKALAGPFRDVRFVPTGGINAANLASYLALPQVPACGGSWMVAPALLEAGDFARVRQLTAQAVGIVASLRDRG